jgi:response regulator RpfG family c-di-GMP phosphodiesterase
MQIPAETSARLALTAEPSAVGQPDAKPCHPATLLYIEDDPDSVSLVRAILARETQLELLSAESGEAGWELARERVPDLILLDLNLPDVPGEEVLSRLAAHERTRAVPVIVLTVDSALSREDRLRKAGVAEYVRKPLDAGGFLDLLRLTLNHHS